MEVLASAPLTWSHEGRHAEVGSLEDGVGCRRGEEEVLGLEVAVDDVAGVAAVHRAHHRLAQLGGVPLAAGEERRQRSRGVECRAWGEGEHGVRDIAVEMDECTSHHCLARPVRIPLTAEEERARCSEVKCSRGGGGGEGKRRVRCIAQLGGLPLVCPTEGGHGAVL